MSPRNVRVTPQSRTAALVQWDGLFPCSEVNGNIVRYDVKYRELPNGETETEMVLGSWDAVGLQVTLTGLTAFTTYSIEIAAVNDQGDVGVFSTPQTVLTDPDSEPCTAL